MHITDIWVLQNSIVTAHKISDLVPEPTFPIFKDIINENHREKLERWKAEHRGIITRQDNHILATACVTFQTLLEPVAEYSMLEAYRIEEGLGLEFRPLLDNRHLQYMRVDRGLSGKSVFEFSIEYAFTGSMQPRRFTLFSNDPKATK